MHMLCGSCDLPSADSCQILLSSVLGKTKKSWRLVLLQYENKLFNCGTPLSATRYEKDGNSIAMAKAQGRRLKQFITRPGY